MDIEQEFFKICKKDNLEELKELIEGYNYLNNKMLFPACKNGALKSVKYLIEEKYLNFHIIDGNRKSILFPACESGNLDLVKYLIEEKHLNVNSINGEKKSILFPACESGNLDLVKYLIEEKNLNVNIMDDRGESIFSSACRFDNLELTKYLVEEKNLSPILIDKSRRTPLSYACKNIPSKDSLLEYFHNVHNDYYKVSELLLVRLEKHFTLIKYLVEHGYRDSKYINLGTHPCGDNAPLLLACENIWNLNIMAPFYPIPISLWSGNIWDTERIQYVEFLRRIVPKYFEIIKYLINNGANVNVRDSFGRTILSCIAGTLNMDLIKFFIDNGMTVETINSSCHSTNYILQSKPILFSVCDNFELVKYLVEHGANINVKTNFHDNILSHIDSFMEATTITPLKLKDYKKTRDYLVSNGAKKSFFGF